MTEKKLKTLKDIERITLVLDTGVTRESNFEEGFLISKSEDLREEQIKWIKETHKLWVTDSHTNNSHFVLEMWMESLNITDEDLK